MKMRKFFNNIAQYFPQTIVLISVLSSNVITPAIVIAEEIENSQGTITHLEEEIPIDESEDILEEGISTSIYEEEGLPEEEVVQEVEEEIIEEDVIEKEIKVPEKENPIAKVWENDGSPSKTVEPIILDRKYVSPQNNNVTVTFTKLPDNPGYLTIEEVTLTDREVLETNAVSRIAYDITTDMEDGTFEYDLTLPSYEEGIKVLYSENRDLLLDTVQEVDNTIFNENGNIKIEDLDHFTIYIVTTEGNTPTLTTATVNNQTSVSVESDEDITVNLTVTTDSWHDDYDDWRSTAYRFNDESWVCENTTYHLGDGTYSDTFTISAPKPIGTYDLDLRVYNLSNCGGNSWQRSDVYSMEDAIFVNNPLVLCNDPIDDYSLNSSVGIWTDVNGGSNVNGEGTDEVRWGIGNPQSGLRFDSVGAQTFNENTKFLLGTLTHMNWPIQNAANGATLEITLSFSEPAISPNPTFEYYFDIEETTNRDHLNQCPSWQETSTPCDDRITFPSSYGDTVITIGDIQYTLVIDGFVDSYACEEIGSVLNYFITEERKDNSAYLVGRLSSVLIEEPAISITKKTNDLDVEAPGHDLTVGDSVTWQYIIQNTGNVDLINISVVDDQGVTVACSGQTTLVSGASMTCTATGTVTEGQYSNTATVTANPVGGEDVTDSDSSWYNGVLPPTGSITIIKDSIPNDPQDFAFTGNLGNFSLDDDSDPTLPNSHTSGDLLEDTYTITEPSTPGWELTDITCVGGSDTSTHERNAVIKLKAGEDVICTFTNTKQKGTLTVIKNVINDNGGTKGASDFSFSVNGDTAVSFESDGQNDLIVDSGLYTITEPSVAGYTTSYSNCTDVNIPPGGSAMCTITNDDQQAYIIVDKKVINDDGGSANPDDFNLTVDDNPVLDEVLYAVNPGSHIAGETNLSGYIEGTWDGDCDSSGNVTVALGETKTCSITNDDIAPTLTLVKVLPNDDGGNEDQSAFNAYIDGIPAVWGANITSAGTHTVSESTLPGYNASVWGGDCSDTGIVSLNPGDNKTCTITNDDEAPSITLIKNVVNDDIGTATENDFGLIIDGNPATSGVAYDVIANSPIVLDEFGLAGYSFVSITGVGCPTDLGSTVTLDEGEDIICTITNDDIPPVIINAHKIVCSNESELPDWGTGGSAIDENTAQNWVDSHNSCEFEEGWSFQWGDEGPSSINPGDNTGESLDVRWHTFGTTDINGLATAVIPAEEVTGFNYIWMREVWENDYLPFTYNFEGGNNSNNVTAEIYCHTDVLNYDNLDRIDNIENGETYYCVAWNVLNKGDLEVTKTVDWTGITPDPSQTFEICISGPSYPTGDCKVFDYDGEVLTWTDLLVGDYTITETDSGSIWSVTGSGSTVYVSYETQPSHEVLNTYVPYCGDGVFNQESEECDGDDGVTDGENFCTSTCKLIPIYDGNHTCAPGTTPIKIGDTHVLGSQDPTGIDITLINGQEYLFKVSGIYQFGNNSNRLADAAYGTEDAWSSTRPDLGIGGTTYRGVLSILADLGIGVGVVEWDDDTTFNDSHVYQKVFTPTDDITAKFLISDWYDSWYANSCNNQSCMGDNSGSLDLEVYECQEYGSIQGRKYYDVNANGDFDQVEKDEAEDPNRLDDWTIQLWNNDFSEMTDVAITGEDTPGNNVGKGQYRFVDVIPGTYHVCEVLKDEWYQTEPTSGQEHEGAHCHTVTVTPGDEITGIQFGNYEGSDVTICKLDAESNGLSGWKVILRDINPLESVTVGTDGGTYSSSVLSEGDYALLSSGTYEYRGSSGLLTDPAYSERLPSDGYTGEYFPWINTMNLGTPGALGIMINGLPTNWGDYLSENHKYALGFYDYPGGQFNFSVYDNYYSDNVGNMYIDIYNGYADITEENGCYTFENVPFGTYQVDEIMKDGWRNVSGLTEVTIDEAVEEFEIINELDVYDIHGFKWEDLDGDGEFDEELELLLSGWKIFIDEDGDGEWGETEPYDMTDDGDHLGWYLFEGLVPGEYKVCEELEEGWVQTYPTDPVCHTVTLPDYLSNCDMTENAVTACEYNFGNFQKGSVRGCKYNDINGSGVRSGKVTDEGIEEPQLSGWIIRLYDSLWDKIAEDVTDPHFNFDYLMEKGTYYLCEVMQPGWAQTEPGLVGNYGYTLVPNLSGDDTEGISCKQINVNESGFEGSHYYGFGNIEDSELYVSETNDSWPNTLVIGDTFTYTITVRALNGPVTEVELINLPPEGFVPQEGTFSATSTNPSHVIDTSAVHYTSPGTWDLGDLEEGEEITITYQALVTGTVDAGTYPDLSFAQGKGTGGSDILALSELSEFPVTGGRVDENFVGTQVKVEEQPELDEGEVLGAAVELPRTGANTYLTLGAILSMIIGFIMLLINPKKKIGSLIVTGAILLSVFLIAKPTPTYAFDDIAVQIEQPETPTDKQSFDIGYVALDLQDRILTIDCYEETYGLFNTYNTNSGNCKVDETIITESGTYNFYIEVIPEGSTTPVKSKTVTVVIDLDTPEAVVEYDKDEGTCTYTLTFTTADDGRTSKVQVFRSDIQPFTANASTLIDEISVVPNQDVTYTDTGLPNCDTEYYYALRAVDDLNNTSPFVTDNIVTLVQGTTPTTVTVLGETGEIAGEATTTQENETEENDTTDEDGEIAGEETTTNEEENGEEGDENGEEKTFWQKYWFVILAAGVLLVITVGYTYAQRRRY